MVFKFIGHDPLYVTGGLYDLNKFTTNKDGGIRVWITERTNTGRLAYREMLYGSLQAFEMNWEKY